MMVANNNCEGCNHLVATKDDVVGFCWAKAERVNKCDTACEKYTSENEKEKPKQKELF